MVKKIPGLFFTSTRLGLFIPIFLLFIISLVNRQIAKYLNEKWTGISPWWAAVPISFLLIYGVMVAIYERDKELYSAYKASQKEAMDLSTKLESLTKPNLIGNIDGYLAVDVTDDNSTQIFLCI